MTCALMQGEITIKVRQISWSCYKLHFSCKLFWHYSLPFFPLLALKLYAPHFIQSVHFLNSLESSMHSFPPFFNLYGSRPVVLLNNPHLLRLTQQMFILIAPYIYKQKYFAFAIKENGRILNLLFSNGYAPYTYSLTQDRTQQKEPNLNVHCFVWST